MVIQTPQQTLDIVSIHTQYNVYAITIYSNTAMLLIKKERSSNSIEIKFCKFHFNLRIHEKKRSRR